MALKFDHSLPGWLLLPGCMIAAGAFGAIWALIPAWLYAKRGSHVVITTIMFNFIAAALMTYLLVEVLIKPGQQSPESRELLASAWMPAMTDILGAVGVAFAPSPLNLAFLVALVAAGIFWILVERTRWGYALNVAGQNPVAAHHAGISANRVILWSMGLSGFLAGGVGVNEILGVQHRLLLDFPGGAGFVGIAVALMGRNHPVGIVAAAVLFGALYQGGAQLSFDMPHVNRDMIAVIQGLVILICGAFEQVLRKPLVRWWRKGT
jgi:simple sugar transport system permease protein